ncbi:MAG TPA: ubiquinol-cytochrome c reductase iron-sulfur subunit [Gammaproteobacteria bacterium]|nr:ubiquinol-cytochrome c reductase iron-sulfur subunit [Gammaproteobacteria bacterium]
MSVKQDKDEKDSEVLDRKELSKRRFLTATTAALGTAGIGVLAVPFVKSLEPDAAAAAASVVTVDISEIPPGGHLTTSWQQKPLIIVHRTPEMLATLSQVTSQLKDPDNKVPQQPSYAQNIYRSRKPEWLIMMQVCTHLCCSPTYDPKKGTVSSTWLGGFFCACHGSRYDLSGRVMSGSPAPENMVVPEYTFIEGGKSIQVTGLDKKSKLC